MKMSPDEKNKKNVQTSKIWENVLGVVAQGTRQGPWAPSSQSVLRRGARKGPPAARWWDSRGSGRRRSREKAAVWHYGGGIECVRGDPLFDWATGRQAPSRSWCSRSRGQQAGSRQVLHPNPTVKHSIKEELRMP